jgi:hypothetical protein
MECNNDGSDIKKIDFMVGISPQYWSHVPMNVIDVLNLQLRDGINHLCIPKHHHHHHHQQQQQQTTTTTIDSQEDYYMYIPVSKCLLVGAIVYADQRRDGSMVYVIDDGTGMIDCVHWAMADSQQDIYQLPSLERRSNEKEAFGMFSIGDRVRIFGKIDCLAKNDNITIREIQAGSIELIEDVTSETRHWIRCTSTTYTTVASCLEQLGPNIQSQIKARVNLPAADDKMSSWRVFGTSCRCQLDYMENLLYCHCQCKLEPLDPFHKFRDALIRTLLEMQSKSAKMLVFKYKLMKQNEELRSIASREVTWKGATQTNNVDMLFVNTFRALRQDGVIYLLNSNTDEYLLITREKVMEPFVRDQMRLRPDMARNYISMESAPPYLSSRVHNERLLYIKRSIWAATKQNQDDDL